MPILMQVTSFTEGIKEENIKNVLIHVWKYQYEI